MTSRRAGVQREWRSFLRAGPGLQEEAAEKIDLALGAVVNRDRA